MLRLWPGLWARLSGELIGQGTAAPITVGGSSPALLAFHGFGGTPLEVELIVDVARELGLAARAPLLPGHGSNVRDLAKRRWQDWVQAAEQVLDETQGPVVVAGLSLGALIAAHLAQRSAERVRALLMLGNAAWLTPSTTRLLRLVESAGLPDFTVPKLWPDIEDRQERRAHLTYGSQPVHAALEVLRGGTEVRRVLDGVACPTLIAHGARDRVCPAVNAAALLPLFRAPEVRVVVFEKSRHIITRDVERRRVRALVKAFVCEFAGPVA
jgi:carboxylesterase